MVTSKKIVLVLIVILLLVTMNIWAIPPHPDLLKEWRSLGRLPQLSAKLSAMKNAGMNYPAKSFPTTGTRNVLVILVSYSTGAPKMTFDDLEYATSTESGANSAIEYFTELWETNTDSFKQYYLDMSNGNLILDFHFYGPVQVSNNASYYGANSGNFDIRPRELVKEALTLAEGLIDYTAVDFDGDNDDYIDAVAIIHAGYPEEISGNPSTAIWSHNWSLTGIGDYATGEGGYFASDYIIMVEYLYDSDLVAETIEHMTIGVAVHEFGHILGLPDLYDINYATNGTGDWSLMASGAWNGTNGSNPAPLLAWSKDYLGWITVDDATSLALNNSEKTINMAGIGIIGVVVLLSILLAIFLIKKKKSLISIIPMLSFVLVFALIFIVTNCDDDDPIGGAIGSRYSVSWNKTASLEDIETGHRAIKLRLGYSCEGGEQYYLLENKVNSGTWDAELPGEGLLITHIDEYILYYMDYGGYDGTLVVNSVNSLQTMDGYPWAHGVNVIEADASSDDWLGWGLWNYSEGTATDLFYAGNNTSITSSTTPSSQYIQHYSDNSYTTESSGVSITNITGPGATISFSTSKD